MTKKELIDATKSLTYCIEHDALEDAHQWCLDIIKELYQGEVSIRSKLETAIDTARRRTT